MQEIRSSSRTGLVELLATWELTSLPGVPGLFRVMSRFRGLDELALLGRVADSPGIALVPGLRDEVRGVLKKARDPSSVEPEFRRHVSDVMGKTSDALASYADEQRGTLQRDLLECAAGLPQTDRERVFQRLWKSAGSGAGGRLDQVRAIDDARDVLDRAKKKIRADEMDSAGQEVPEDDPAAVAEARQALETAMARGVDLLKTAGNAPPIARELLETVLADAKTMFQKEKLTLRTLAEQQETLETLSTDLADAGFSAAFTTPSRSVGKTGTQERDKSAAELRRRVATSTEELNRLAANLPTAQVIRFRARLSDAEATAYTDDRGEMKRRLGELQKDSDEMGRLADQQRRFEEDRSAAETERMAAEIERLEEVARGRDAKRLQGMLADLEQRKNRAKVAAALPPLAARIANGERLELATLLGRAQRCSEKARGPIQAEIDDAEAALAGDDLAGISTAAEGLGQALRKAAPWRGLRGTVVVWVLFIAVLAAGVFGVRKTGDGKKTASFPFEMADGVGQVEMKLIHEGAVFKTIPVTGGSVDVTLPAGRFEIFINDRYTGRVVRMPQDAGSIEPIKVPQ